MSYYLNTSNLSIPNSLICYLAVDYRYDVMNLGIDLTTPEDLVLVVDGREFEVTKDLDRILRRELDLEPGYLRDRLLRVETLKVKGKDIEIDLPYLLLNVSGREKQIKFDPWSYALIHKVPLESINCIELAQHARICYAEPPCDEVIFENDAEDYFYGQLRSIDEYILFCTSKFVSNLHHEIQRAGHKSIELNLEVAIANREHSIVIRYP